MWFWGGRRPSGPSGPTCKGSSASRRGWHRRHGTRKEGQLARGRGGAGRIPREQPSSGVRPAPGCHGDPGPGRPSARGRPLRGLSRGSTGAALHPAPPPRPPRAAVRDPEKPEGAPCFREPPRSERGRSRLPPPQTRPVGEAALEPNCRRPAVPGLPRPLLRHQPPVPQVRRRLPRLRPRSPGKHPPSGVRGRPWGHRRGSWGGPAPKRASGKVAWEPSPNRLPTPFPF